MSNTLTSDIGPYAVTPAWLLEADISDRAFRLYCYLALRVNRDKGYAWPTRKRIADALRCSPKSVDRAVQELIEIGAIEVRKRRSEYGDWDSNIYVVRHVQGVASPVTPLVTGDQGLAMGDQGGRDTGDARGRDTGDALINNHLELTTEEPWNVVKPRSEDDHSNHQPLFIALVTALNINPREITPPLGAEIGKAAKNLRTINADPAEVPVRADRYRRKFPKAALTPSALAKHWASLGADDPDDRIDHLEALN